MIENLGYLAKVDRTVRSQKKRSSDVSPLTSGEASVQQRLMTDQTEDE
jgi:hypothetical protein